MTMLAHEKKKLLNKSKDQLIEELMLLERKNRTKSQIIEDIDALQNRIVTSRTLKSSSPHKVIFKPQSVIYNEGEEGDAVYIILNGQVEFRKSAAGNKVKKVATIGQGDMFGELALFDNRPRAATAVALKKTELYRVSKDEFTDQLSTVDPAVKFVAESLTRRVRHLLDDLLRKKR